MLVSFRSEANNYRQIPAFKVQELLFYPPTVRINSPVSVTNTEYALCGNVACFDVHTKQRQPGQGSLEEGSVPEEIMKMKSRLNIITE